MTTSEDKLHRYLLLALAAGAAALLLLREPASERHAASTPASDPRASELQRSELDAGISTLTQRLARERRAGTSAREANLLLLALGRAALAPGELEAEGTPASRVRANLDALAASASAQPVALARPTTVPPGPAPASGSSASGAPSAATPAGGEVTSAAPHAALPTDDEREGAPSATLAILLEAGTPLEQRVSLTSGAIDVQRLLALAIAGVASRRERLDPWAMDLLSFGVLAGMHEQREELARLAEGGLQALDRELRGSHEGRGTPEAGAASNTRPELGAAVFRAVAVLADPALEKQALLYLGALLRRYPLQRDAYGERLARASSADERTAIHLEAVEALGRLEQTLFGAQLLLRRSDGAGPPPRAARSMRRAARDLLEHLDALRASAALDAPLTGDAAATRRLRALTHALRGLRAARVAI